MAPKARDRIAMVTLSDAGWFAQRIAAHLVYHPRTVRDALRAFLAHGAAALNPFRIGPPTDAQRLGQVTSAVCELLGQSRTWTSRQLCEALAGRGNEIGPR